MKPINDRELKKAYITFGINFLILGLFSILCLYFFFATQRHEYRLLQHEVDDAEQLLSKRKDINTQFDLMQNRFNELSRFSSINAEEMDNQAIMLADIQTSIFKIKDLLKQQHKNTPSFALYQKMADDAAQMAGIQDSLFTTRFQLESVKSQLDACLRLNKSAQDKLSLGIFRR